MDDAYTWTYPLQMNSHTLRNTRIADFSTVILRRVICQKGPRFRVQFRTFAGFLVGEKIIKRFHISRLISGSRVKKIFYHC